ncbi:DUF3304 domain-containing protein [Variovorax sp. 770b2]|uniref:DUF3304 domain-containing protein n=1 Tax=Variovorax sp. 770b2 TaxID=1566271 RepID=UPI0008EB1B24|nr:DUF3304 domain-containing protein [Variovorax sp. 770b2]SFQ42015.1 Protein of unknown function [Variovorax sp. 770b2]
MLRRNWLLHFLLLASWASTGCALGRTDLVPASVSGVNYTGDDISYMLFDPDDAEKKVAASEELGPFSAGGIRCCYALPKTWTPGTRVGVMLDVYDEKAGKYGERKTFVVDLPPYDKEGKAGDVWFILYPDRSVGVVSTAYRPNADEWPGKIKGWPKPSVEYQRKLWDRDMKLAQEGLATSKEFKEAFDRDPKQYLKELWIRHLENVKNKQVGLARAYSRFSGPDDPALFEFERGRREASLKYSQDKVDRLQKVKP